MKENIDGVTDIWLPDKELCAQGDELRKEKEWLRKKNGFGGIKPSKLGIESYRWGSKLPDKFFEGQTPPPVPLDSLENLEWYEDQLKRCIYGFEWRGNRITGDHYWMLNFTPFLVAKKNKSGSVTSDFDVLFPYHSYMHDYIFKLIEEAHYERKAFAWMSGRGTGKTYSILSIISKIYHLKPKSHGMVSASNSTHAEEAFNKLRLMLDSIAEVHPTLALARIQDTKQMIESGYEVTRDGVKHKEGPRSRVQRIVYGDNPGVTRGSRPDVQLLEEIGDWSSGAGDLKSCIGASIGSWRVGANIKCRVFLIGTGGSVKSDQAKDVFLKPRSYNILPLTDFEEKGSGFFLPAHYLLGGHWENTGVNNNDAAKEWLDEERDRTKDDMEVHQKTTQEFPYTIREVFSKMGTNNFNQRKIAEQWGNLQFNKDIPKPERGFLNWIKAKNGMIKGVKWEVNPEGDTLILEHPYRGEDGKTTYSDLYVGGVDSIDQGQIDSTSNKGRSSLACLIKKRIIDGKFFSHTSNIYVAMYVGRSTDVRFDYENTLKLAMYYGAKINIEYTKIGIVSYFRECKQYHMLMKRPTVAMPSGGDGREVEFGIKRTNLIGTPATPNVIDHQDGKIKEYIDDYYQNIYFEELLEQLRDYLRDDRTKFDLVIAMGLCELADEDFMGVASKEDDRETKDFKVFGYYVDEYGRTQFGSIPNPQSTIDQEITTEDSPVRWVDMSGRPRFDDNFDVLLDDIQ
jgi:hypothetical protein